MSPTSSKRARITTTALLATGLIAGTGAASASAHEGPGSAQSRQTQTQTRQATPKKQSGKHTRPAAKKSADAGARDSGKREAQQRKRPVRDGSGTATRGTSSGSAGTPTRGTSTGSTGTTTAGSSASTGGSSGSTSSGTSSATTSTTSTTTATSISTTGLQPNAVQTLQAIRANFPQITTTGGVRADSLPDHPSGRALDLMIPGYGTSAGRALGDQVAAYLISHADELDVKYVIWRQQIWVDGASGWRAMADRGGVTANHYDHVHVTVH
ncbi:MAG: hypothetical protein LWW86_09115 [Micrococcales bacterium]|nr:hypothetical protein [Micrococcales bacterium]